MAKLATRQKAPPKAAIKSKKGRKPDALTYNAGPGFSREAKSELFLLAVTNMVSEDTFYERGKNRDERFTKLVRQVALDDPDWIARFVPYLRNTMNMRSASIVMAAELVHAKLTQPVPASKIHNRAIIDSAIVRADEPAEMLGYWMSEWGKNLPQPVKRGVADAVARVYNERNTIKYDGGDHAIRFGDVVELVHPTPGVEHWRAPLFKHLIDTRHNRDGLLEGDTPLVILAANSRAMAMDQDAFKAAFAPAFVREAALTWEQASSKYGKLDAKFWEAMIPNMGIFAMVRNLRNFEDADIGKAAADVVRGKLESETAIRESRMFPLRFMAAYTASKSLAFARELETAIDHSVSNIPSLKGKTLVMVDISGSMDAPLSAKSETKRMLAAAVFGVALAKRAEKADLVAYSDTTAVIPVRKMDSILRTVVELIGSMQHGGTATWQSTQRHFSDHDRIVVITDEQANAGYSLSVPDAFGKARCYTFNVAGYRVGHAPSGKKGWYTFGGLTDQAFTALELLEKGNDETWPF